MLVLTRKPGQSIHVGDDIRITLKEIKGNQVRVGIDAPSSIKIYREEIYQQILEENKSAALLSLDVPSDLGDVAKAWEGLKPKALEIIPKKAKKVKK